jgi:amidase
MRRLDRTQRHQYFAPDVPPALRVEPGETIRVETSSLLTLYPDGGIPARYEAISLPVTGPVFVEGARPGDALRVEIRAIDLPTGRGVVMALPGLGVMGNENTTFTTKLVTYDNKHVYFNDRIKIPVRKMVGKIGTAPRERAWSSAPGPHGGNLDNTHIGEGSLVYLPVSVDGGLLYVGDLHAAQGDGEPFSGVESEGDVVLSAEVERGLAIENPVVVTAEAVVTCGAGVTLEAAVQNATRDAIRLLEAELRLSHAEACMLCTIGCDIRLSQVMNPLLGAKVVVPRTLLPGGSRWSLPTGP